ncbi:GIN domain-containing protein [Chloroflexota bacterium]
MRKTITPIILLATLITVLLPGCEAGSLGKIVSEEKDFTNFTSVDIEGAFEVKITQAASFKTTVSADENFFDYIAVSKTDDTLRIYLNPHHTFTDFTLGAKTMKAEITMPNLRGLRLSGATKATITGFKSPDDFNLEVSGASTLEMSGSEVGDAKFEISGASKVTGDIKAEDTVLEISGASKAELKGSAYDIVLNVSGASNANLTDFILNDANVKLSGASQATLHIKGRLDCVVNAASSLYFLGNPTMGNVQVTGASTIKHK